MASILFKYNTPRTFLPGFVILCLFTYYACTPMEEDQSLLMTIDHMEFVSEGSYTITGTMASLGEEDLSRFGVCWSETEKPDLRCSFLDLDLPSSTGEFNLTVSGLSPQTTYYFRAYAMINSVSDYSEEKAFTTRLADDDMLMDVDGNIYKVVKIGDQVWMTENLKTSRFADETPIPYTKDRMDWFDFTRESPGYCWYGNVQTHGDIYGGLYTWAAATAAHDGISLIEEGVQGICPDDWHLPSDEEWKSLELYLGMNQEEADASKWRGSDQGGKLKIEGSEFWNSPNTGATDEVGFRALGGGFRHGSGEFLELSETTRYWTSTARGYGFAWYRGLDNDTAAVYRDFIGVYRGHAVRCVKDD